MELILLVKHYNPTSPKELLSLFATYGLSPSKRYGQNFLIDNNIASKIIAALDLKNDDMVVEVGPGAGALTMPLAEKGIRVLAIEVDKGLTCLLEEQLKHYDKIKIINEDIMKISWTEILSTFFHGRNGIKLVSNLPYNISGPFLYSIFKAGFPFSIAVMMLQKEVAFRLAAKTSEPDYSGLSVMCRYYSEPRKLFNVSGNVFWPKPGVDSTVVRLDPVERLLPAIYDKHFSFLVTDLFQQRRKTMVNNLKRFLSISREEAVSILDTVSIDPLSRPDHLSVEQFAKLSSLTYNYYN